MPKFIVLMLILLITAMLSSCAEPVNFGDLSEEDFVSNRARQSPDQTEATNDNILELPPEATSSPSEFIEFLKTVDIEKAKRIEISDSFFDEFTLYINSYYKDTFNYQEEPSPLVNDILEFMEECVGGNYLFGGQGHIVTRAFVNEVNDMYPNYMNGGRLEYFFEIADSVDEDNPRMLPEYPYDYAWDCSGLWWDCCNSLNLFDEYTDRTANQTYDDFCTPITKEELQPGDLVFYRNVEGKISHMGIMGTNGYIYEAASGFVGVVKQHTLDMRIYKDVVRGGFIISPTWNEYGRPIMFQ